MFHFDRYSIEKRKRIARWSIFILAMALFVLLVLVYSSQRLPKHRPLSGIIEAGYTTILDKAQSHFGMKK